MPPPGWGDKVSVPVKGMKMRTLVYYNGVRPIGEIIPSIRKHAQESHAVLDIVECMIVSGPLPMDELKKKENDLQYIKEILENDHIPCVEHILIPNHDKGFDLEHFLKENAIDEIMLCTAEKISVLNVDKLNKGIKQNNLSLTDIEKIISGREECE